MVVMSGKRRGGEEGARGQGRWDGMVWGERVVWYELGSDVTSCSVSQAGSLRPLVPSHSCTLLAPCLTGNPSRATRDLRRRHGPVWTGNLRRSLVVSGRWRRSRGRSRRGSWRPADGGRARSMGFVMPCAIGFGLCVLWMQDGKSEGRPLG